jgi:hypothetical protein
MFAGPEHRFTFVSLLDTKTWAGTPDVVALNLMSARPRFLGSGPMPVGDLRPDRN